MTPHPVPTRRTTSRSAAGTAGRARHLALGIVLTPGLVAGLAACGGDGHDSRPADATPVAASTGTDPAAGSLELTPKGYGALELGMTAAEAEATGIAQHVRPPAAPGCGTFDLGAHRADQTDGYVSPTYGVVAIFARGTIATPEGIRLGSTLGQVKATYPTGHLDDNGYWVVRPPAYDDRHYEFGAQPDGTISVEPEDTISEMALVSDDQDCFG